MRLCIDRIPILEWFKMKFHEIEEKLGVNRIQKEGNRPKRGIKNIISYKYKCN